MELADQVTDLSEVSSEWQALYKQEGDGWVLKGPEDTSGLKSALAKEREARKKLEKKMKNTQDPDEELETLRSAVEEYKTKERERGIKDTLRAAAIKSGIREEHIDKVITLTRSQFVVTEDGGIATEDGKSAERFFSGAYKKAEPIFYKGPGKSGSGAAPNLGKGQKSEQPKSWRDSVMEKSGKLTIDKIRR